MSQPSTTRQPCVTNTKYPEDARITVRSTLPLFSDPPPSKIQTAASPLPPLTESENRKFQILVILSRKIGVRLARKNKIS